MNPKQTGKEEENPQLGKSEMKERAIEGTKQLSE